jgi:hypothetical protein
MQYSMHAVRGVCCTPSMLYLVYTGFGVCCTQFMLYVVYAVLGVNSWSCLGKLVRDDFNACSIGDGSVEDETARDERRGDNSA